MIAPSQRTPDRADGERPCKLRHKSHIPTHSPSRTLLLAYELFVGGLNLIHHHLMTVLVKHIYG